MSKEEGVTTSELSVLPRSTAVPHLTYWITRQEEKRKMDKMQTIIRQIADTAAQRALELAHAPTRYLKSKEAAQYLDVAYLTLEKWRALGQGPAFTRVGKFIRYDRQDLDAFMHCYRNQFDDSVSVFPRSTNKMLRNQ